MTGCNNSNGSGMTNTRRAIVFLAWGPDFIAEVGDCIRGSSLPPYPRILITDTSSVVDLDGIDVIRADFRLEGLARKAEMIDFLPAEYDSFLFLDSDTRVLQDLSLGFEKAEAHGIAASPAPHYCLDHFWGFGDVIDREGMERLGRMQYNTGVLFFSMTDVVAEVFERWRDLSVRYSAESHSDQPYFTLAMEQLGFNPYTLSPSYNLRGFGELISGPVRVWHSHEPLPPDLNAGANAWPPRRVHGSTIIPPQEERPPQGSAVRRVLRKLRPR